MDRRERDVRKALASLQLVDGVKMSVEKKGPYVSVRLVGPRGARTIDTPMNSMRKIHGLSNLTHQIQSTARQLL